MVKYATFYIPIQFCSPMYMFHAFYIPFLLHDHVFKWSTGSGWAYKPIRRHFPPWPH